MSLHILQNHLHLTTTTTTTTTGTTTSARISAAGPRQGLAVTRADVDDDDVDNRCSSRCSNRGRANGQETVKRTSRSNSLETLAPSSAAALRHKVHCVWLGHVSGYILGLSLQSELGFGPRGWGVGLQTCTWQHTSRSRHRHRHRHSHRQRSESVADICVTSTSRRR